MGRGEDCSLSPECLTSQLALMGARSMGVDPFSEVGKKIESLSDCFCSGVVEAETEA